MNELNLPVIDLHGEPQKSSKLYEEFITFDGVEYCLRVMFYGGSGFLDMKGKQVLVNIDQVNPDLKNIANITFPIEKELG